MPRVDIGKVSLWSVLCRFASDNAVQRNTAVFEE